MQMEVKVTLEFPIFRGVPLSVPALMPWGQNGFQLEPRANFKDLRLNIEHKQRSDVPSQAC